MKSSTATLRRDHGFTLIEVMVVIAIMAILATIAAPPMLNQIASSRVTAKTNELIGELARARSDALRFNQVVTIDLENIVAQGGNTDVALTGNPTALVGNITFNTDGTTANIGTITISNSARTTVIRILGSGKAFVES